MGGYLVGWQGLDDLDQLGHILLDQEAALSRDDALCSNGL